MHKEQQQRGDLAAKAREDNVASQINRKKAVAFVNGTLLPAFSELEKGLREQNLRAYHTIEESGTTVSAAAKPATELIFEKAQIEASRQAVYIDPELSRLRASRQTIS